ncbi:MAG: hypothetical protein QXU97_04095 [Fervidicoccaceae archaeon]
MTSIRGSSVSDRERSKVFVLDAAALFAGLQLFLPGCSYTVPEVVEEVKDAESREKLERSLEAGKLIVVSPSSRVEARAPLSSADVALLSLALELSSRGASVVVVTDDYALQLAVKEAGLTYMPIKTLGVDRSPKRVGGGRR